MSIHSGIFIFIQQLLFIQEVFISIQQLRSNSCALRDAISVGCLENSDFETSDLENSDPLKDD